MPTGTSSAGIARPASDGQDFGIARDIPAKRGGLPRRSTLPKSPPRSEGAGHEHASDRTDLSRCYHHRRSGMGVSVSDVVGGEKGRESSCLDRQAGADRPFRRQEPALPPRTGRRVAEGSRGAPSEGKAAAAEQPSLA